MIILLSFCYHGFSIFVLAWPCDSTLLCDRMIHLVFFLFVCLFCFVAGFSIIFKRCTGDISWAMNASLGATSRLFVNGRVVVMPLRLVPCKHSTNAEAARAAVVWVNSSAPADDFCFLRRWLTVLIIYTLIEQTHKGYHAKTRVLTSNSLVLSLRRTVEGRISTVAYLPLSPAPSFYSLQQCPHSPTPSLPIAPPPTPSVVRSSHQLNSPDPHTAAAAAAASSTCEIIPPTLGPCSGIGCVVSKVQKFQMGEKKYGAKRLHKNEHALLQIHARTHKKRWVVGSNREK